MRAQALVKAAACGDLEALASLEVPDECWNGWPALHEATHRRNVAAVRLLLDRGASVNSADDDGVTALHVAAGAIAVDVARLLLERKALVNARGYCGWTPLAWASRPGGSALSELLFQHGASLTNRDENGKTPLDLDAYGFLARMPQRLARCQSAALALLGCPIHHDVRYLLARLVWGTRRDPVWDERGAKKQCF
jgi:hypothetical protein